MKKKIGVLVLAALMLLAASAAFAKGGQEEGVKAEKAAKTETLKIAYFVSDMTNVFHQGSYTAAKKYAMEKYGAEVYAFDG